MRKQARLIRPPSPFRGLDHKPPHQISKLKRRGCGARSTDKDPLGGSTDKDAQAGSTDKAAITL